MDKFMALFFAFCAGIFTIFEAAINSKLASYVTPKIATLHNLITGVLVILAYNFLRGSLKQYPKVIHVSPQWLIGGIFGTFIVYLGIKSVPQLGIATALTVIVLSQLISSVIMDSVLYDERPIDKFKVIGIIFLTLGTYCLMRE